MSHSKNAGDSPEIQELRSWLGDFPRSPRQTHGLNESDAEVLRLRPDLFLASTTDSLSEEWQCGLYQDPYTLGWMTATASLSDLAAVGAAPIGVLLSVEWPREFDLAMKQRFGDGVRAALSETGTFLLGGDSGNSEGGSWTATALGTSDSPLMSRVGLLPGWIVGLSRPAANGTGLGCGPALGMRRLLGAPESDFPESDYRPHAQLALGQALLRAGVRVCIDTSDGFLSSLALLSELNGQLGFELDWQEALLDARAKSYFKKLSFPLLGLWAFEHGDYQLLFAAPEAVWEKLEDERLAVIRLGQVITEAGRSTVRTPEGTRPLDLTFARRILNPPKGLQPPTPWPERARQLQDALRQRQLP